MSRLQNEYDQLADRLKALVNQKRRIESGTIMDTDLKAAKVFDEIMTFLNP